jgi:hypothetical protein
MNLRLKYLVICVGLLAIVLSGSALFGQSNKTDPPPDPNKSLAQVANMLRDMVVAGKKVERLLLYAKRQKDIVKIACISDILVNELKPLIQIARERLQAIQTSMKNSGAVDWGQEQTMMGLHRDKADEKVAEAEKCAGEAIVVSYKPDVKEIIDPSVPQWDPTEPSGPIWVMPRPPEASPYF